MRLLLRPSTRAYRGLLAFGLRPFRGSQRLVFNKCLETCRRVDLQKPFRAIPRNSDIFNSSFFVGENHSHWSPKRFLLNSLELLKSRGFEILFMEHLMHGLGNDFLLQWKNYLSFLDLDPNLDYSYTPYFLYFEIVKKAIGLGMQVIGLDFTLIRRKKWAFGPERQATFNFYAKTIIEKFPNTKWIAFMGGNHVFGNDSYFYKPFYVPGMNGFFGAPGIDIIDTDIKTPATTIETIKQNERFVIESSEQDKTLSIARLVGGKSSPFFPDFDFSPLNFLKSLRRY